ncbi:MAG: hypothetical protein ACJ761_00955 [Chloroflexota bacterium]
MNRRILAGVLLAIVLVGGFGLVASFAYQAGASTAVVATGSAATPVVIPAYGWGFFHPWGFGLFGFFGLLLFLFIVFALIRAIAWGGRGYGRGGWGRGYGRGWGGPGHWDDPEHRGRIGDFEERARDTFEDWHRQAHGTDRPAGPSGSSTPPEPPATA